MNFGPVFGPADPRTDAQRAADRRTTDRLVEKMSTLDDSADGLQARVLHHLQRRRAHRPTGFVRFDLLEGAAAGVVVTPGEVLLRRTTFESPEFRSYLSTAGLDGVSPTPVDGLDGHLLRLAVGAGQASAVRAYAGGSAEAAPVELSHVAEAMGVVKKATPPVLSAGGAPAPPAFPAQPAPSGVRPVRIAIIDTGITDQPRTDGWLTTIPVTPANLDGLDLLPQPNHKLDFAAGHGTFVAGVVQQVAPAAEVTIRRAIDTDGMASTVDLAVEMVAAARAGADVLSLSFGLETEGDAEPLPFQIALDLIEELRTEGRKIVVVAAAGNSGTDRITWPGASPHVLAVAGLTQDMAPAAWSTHGDWVDCSTVAEGVRSTFPQGVADSDADFRDDEAEEYGPDAWVLWVGTSFAAPQVAGAIADLAGRYGVDVETARDLLLAGCERAAGYGRKLEILPNT